MTLVVRTPFGWPVAWAEASLTCDVGDGHAQSDASRLVVSGRPLGRATTPPFGDFLLCLVAEGVTGRASQLALAAFVGSFLASDEVDVLWRLRGAVGAADARLATSQEGQLSSTITALFLADDGTAYGVSVGDSALLVFPPQQDVRGDGGVKILGHEPSTALGTGDLESAGGAGIIEHWWPDLAGDGTRTRLEQGTCRLVTCRDNRRGIAARFVGGQVLTSGLVAQAGWLLSVFGSYGGPWPDATRGFALVCLAEDGGPAIVPGFLRSALELDPREPALCSHAGLEHSFKIAGGELQRTRLAVVAMGRHGATTTFGSGGASAEPTTMHSRHGEGGPHGQGFTLRLGAGSDPLDRGILIEFLQQVVSTSACPRFAEKGGPRKRRWPVGALLSRLGYPRRLREKS